MRVLFPAPVTPCVFALFLCRYDEETYETKVQYSHTWNQKVLGGLVAHKCLADLTAALCASCDVLCQTTQMGLFDVQDASSSSLQIDVMHAESGQRKAPLVNGQTLGGVGCWWSKWEAEWTLMNQYCVRANPRGNCRSTAGTEGVWTEFLSVLCCL